MQPPIIAPPSPEEEEEIFPVDKHSEGNSEEDEGDMFHTIKSIGDGGKYSMIKQSGVHKTFMGSRIFQDEKNQRKQLPHLAEAQVVNVWSIIKKLIGKDLNHISVPCVMNEPLCGLQKASELFLAGEEIFR